MLRYFKVCWLGTFLTCVKMIFCLSVSDFGLVEDLFKVSNGVT